MTSDYFDAGLPFSFYCSMPPKKTRSIDKPKPAQPGQPAPAPDALAQLLATAIKNDATLRTQISNHLNNAGTLANNNSQQVAGPSSASDYQIGQSNLISGTSSVRQNTGMIGNQSDQQVAGPSVANGSQIRRKRKNAQSDFASQIQDVRQNRKRTKEVHLNTISTATNERPADNISFTEQSAAVNDSETSEDEDTSVTQVQGVPNKQKSATHKMLLNFLNDASSEGESSESDDEDSLGIFSDVFSPKITKKIKQKIWKGDYIDLAKLYYGKDDSSVQMHFKKSKDDTVTSVKRNPQRQLNNILSWSRAFQLFASIYCIKFSSEASAMFQYMTIIQTLAQKGQG